MRCRTRRNLREKKRGEGKTGKVQSFAAREGEGKEGTSTRRQIYSNITGTTSGNVNQRQADQSNSISAQISWDAMSLRKVTDRQKSHISHVKREDLKRTLVYGKGRDWGVFPLLQLLKASMTRCMC